MNECVCVRETERDCCCVFEFVNQYAIILWSPEVLPVAVRTCAETHTQTRAHTLTQQSLLSLVSVSRQMCPGQTMLFILMMPSQSQMQPDINTWPSAKQTVPHSVFVFEPADSKKCNDKSWCNGTLEQTHGVSEFCSKY